MATIYAPPKDCQLPEFDYRNFDYDKVVAAEAEFVEHLAVLARRHNKGDLVREIACFPAADGHAQYMVWSHKPLALVHLPIGDPWQIPAPYARGLRLANVRANIDRQQAMSKLFAADSTDA